MTFRHPSLAPGKPPRTSLHLSRRSTGQPGDLITLLDYMDLMIRFQSASVPFHDLQLSPIPE